MFATFVSLALILAPALSTVNAFEFTDYPTTIGSCQDLSVSWEDAAIWPVDVLVVDPSTPCGDALIDVGEVSAASASAKVTYAPGTKLQFSLLDAADVEAWGPVITVTESDDYSCLDAAVAASLEAASPSSTSASAVPTKLVATGGSVTTGTKKATSTASSSSSTDDDSDAVPVGAVGADNTFGDSDGASANAVPVAFMALVLASIFFL